MQAKTTTVKRPSTRGMRVATGLKAGPRREGNAYGDHLGAYNFRVEIDGIDAGQ